MEEDFNVKINFFYYLFIFFYWIVYTMGSYTCISTMIFNIVETLASSMIWLGLCGFGLTIVPIIGIMIIHNKKN